MQSKPTPEHGATRQTEESASRCNQITKGKSSKDDATSSIKSTQVYIIHREIEIETTLKWPLHGKLKLAKSCGKTSKSWQTRSFTRQTRVK